MKRIGILYNPISGKGQSKIVAETLASNLVLQDFSVSVQESAILRESSSLHDFLKSIDILLVAGGDGTLLQLLEPLQSSGTPVYMVPTGNESLFAKLFKMSLHKEDVVRALEYGKITSHNVAIVNGTRFFSMVSVGFDADVVQKVCDGRNAPVKHSGYVLPTLLTAREHRAPVLTVQIDGKTHINKQMGMVLVANTPSYALNAALIPEARSQETSLAVRFFPYQSVGAYFWHMLRCLLSSQYSAQYPLYTGQQVRIESTGTHAVQADGEYICDTPVEISCCEQKLWVLHT